MFKIEVIKDGKEVQFAEFETEAHADKWAEDLAINKGWGEVGTYSTIKTNITAQKETEKSKQEVEKTKKDKAKDDLKKVDWSNVTKISDIVPILKAIYEKIKD